MRINIVHPGAGELRYEIRGIVEFGKKLEAAGVPVIWENIGDPVAKGEEVPQWICDIVAKTANDQMSYAYSPTKGLKATCEFIAKTRTEQSGVQLSPENILFFNGLGDAITKTYTWLNPIARVLGPSPAYPTHSSVEGAHGRSRHLTYNLQPEKEWLPDMSDIKNKIKYNPNIAGLLIINPDNPTGMVYPKHILEQFVQLAKEYNLFLIADEIYANLAYDLANFTSLAELADGVPTIIMRGLSKEVPWPGSRCGWLEFYNTESDPAFATYARSILEAKMIEVCSTTLPQMVLPSILGDKRYNDHLKMRTKKYQERASKAAELLNNVSGIKVVKPKGAFYLAVTFEDGFLSFNRRLKAYNSEAEKLLERELSLMDQNELDKQFCYQLMAHNGLCTVPLTTGFNSHIAGLRMTLLESDDRVFESNLKRLIQAVSEFTES